MALTHQNTSIGAATAALAAAAAQTAWRDALTGHPSGAWTLADEFDSAGGTVHWVVVKNSTAISGVGADFYVCIGRVVATGIMGACVGEVYSSGTKILSKFAPYTVSGASGQYIQADGSFGTVSGTTANFTLSTALPSASGQPICAAAPSAATARLVTSVEKEYAILGWNVTFQYVGGLVDLITPKAGLVATPAIACVNLLDSSPGSFGSITNHPIAAADAPYNCGFAHALTPVYSANQYFEIINMQSQALELSVYSHGDRYQNDRVSASELAGIMHIALAGSTGAKTDKTGALRAKFRGLRWTTGPFAATGYDNISVDGKKHMVLLTLTNIGSLSSYAAFATPNGETNSVLKPMLVFDTGIAG